MGLQEPEWSVIIYAELIDGASVLSVCAFVVAGDVVSIKTSSSSSTNGATEDSWKACSEWLAIETDMFATSVWTQ